MVYIICCVKNITYRRTLIFHQKFWYTHQNCNMTHLVDFILLPPSFCLQLLFLVPTHCFSFLHYLYITICFNHLLMFHNKCNKFCGSVRIRLFFLLPFPYYIQYCKTTYLSRRYIFMIVKLCFV